RWYPSMIKWRKCGMECTAKLKVNSHVTRPSRVGKLTLTIDHGSNSESLKPLIHALHITIYRDKDFCYAVGVSSVTKKLEVEACIAWWLDIF
ncbi:hypothetical protein H5410_022398, partial [Solanum commersonii]